MQEGEEVLWVTIGKRFKAFGLEWQLVSTNGPQASQLTLKKTLLSGVLTFEDANGAALASLTHGLCSSSSKLRWKALTFR